MAFTFDSSTILGAIKRPLVWVSIILALLLIGAVVLERVLHDASKNKILRSQATLILSFKNAPVRIDTVHDTIHLPGKVIIKPIPIKDSITQSLNHSITQLFPIFWYDSIFTHSGIRFRWQAKGDLQFISFSDFVWPKEIITITRQVDTCITKPFPKQPTFRIGPYVGLSLNSFTKFPGIEAGAQVVIKDQLTVSAGGLYLDGIYGNVRLGWLFK
ncbi:MAG: hypothetical protein ACOYNU_15125 [Bacteroidales bacterium]|jgi:hypothetical protein